MRKLVFIFALLLSFGGYAQHFRTVADSEFFYLYGGVNDDIGRCIKETPDGGYIVAGTSSSFGHGDASVYLVKTDSMGKHLWSATYGDAQNDWAYSVEVTSDSGYFVSGYSNSFNPSNGYDAYYFKTNKNGNLLWQKTSGGTDWDFVYGSTAMADGGFVLCGETFTNSNGGTDGYLIRVDKDGNVLWEKHYGDLYDETFNSVAIMCGQIFVVGKNQTHGMATDSTADAWLVKLDTNGNVLKENFIENFSAPNYYKHFAEELLGITPFKDSLFHFCGKADQLDSNATVSIYGRADTSLHIDWTYMDGPASPGTSEILCHVINLSGGNVCALGSAAGGLGGQNMFLAGYDSTDGFINGFVRHSGGTQDDYGYYGIFTSKGKIVGIGSSQSFCSGLNDYFLVRFDGDSISNNVLTGHNPKVVCYADTLPLWMAATHYYSKDLEVKLFPNPACVNTQLEINFPEDRPFTAKVISVLGIEVATYNIKVNTLQTLDISKFAPGNYFIKVQDEYGGNGSVIKFVVSY